ncbi:divalent-cation tolerance protein CutA [Streptomyces boncukensis]|uniref:Divalent-cation tolerance protein CutA n=1 Tax=Streptomyces boncukensis TaxID=2711219 RepID=A0A6G4X3L0_9ACTN|nr:divalent-cation tolerance protein CutA [Streptomyces boncukensis]NGO71437.1 divalent-cation tolerance protein CutA [Streptomyces boncukensis]
MPEILTVVTTIDSEERARALAAGAIERRVAACAQVGGPVRSFFRWEGAVQSEDEWQVQFKTPAARYDALEAYLHEAHAYEVPEILAAPVARASAAYAEWVAEETA